MFLANFIFVVSHLKLHPAVHLNTVGSRKLELSEEQKNSLSYREFEFGL